jgi:site-specific DNA recombinase
MKRAVIYRRVSDPKQDKGYSLQEQLRECERYAKAQGYTVVGVYEDKQTGADMERPGWDALLAAIKPQRIEVVIVDVLDRLARGMAVQLVFEEEISRLGAVIEYANESNDNSDEGRLQKHIKAAIAEYERAKIKRRSKQGKLGKVREGYVVVTMAPYGYDVVSEPKKMWLVVNEDEARIVRLIFHLYVYGDETAGRYSIRGIARKLNEMGVKTRRDTLAEQGQKYEKAVWRPRSVHGILNSPTYIGQWHYNKTSTHTVDGKQGRKDNDASEWITVPVEPLVSQELFDLVQVQLKKNKEQAGRQPKRSYLLTGMLRCKKCQKRYGANTWMYRHKGVERAILYYRCTGNHVIQPKICDMPEFSGELLEGAIWNWLSALVTQPEQIGRMLRAQQEDIRQVNAPMLERLATIEQLQQEKVAERERLLLLYRGGKVPLDLVEPGLMQLTKEIDGLEERRVALANRLDNLLYTDEQISSLEQACAQIGEVEKGLALFTQQEKRLYLERFQLEALLAIEDGQKIAYVSCVFGKERLALSTSSDEGPGSPKNTRNCSRYHARVTG